MDDIELHELEKALDTLLDLHLSAEALIELAGLLRVAGLLRLAARSTN